jgi:hypothetical protein
MNIPKKVAKLRSELELVEASIHDFESLEKARQSSELLTKVAVRRHTSGNLRKLYGRSGDGMAIPKALAAA